MTVDSASRWRPQGETLRYMQVLWGLVHALDVRSKRMSRALGVTGPQRLVLRIIGQQPGSSAGEIARMLDLHASTLTGVLARLETRRMIARRADPADGRRVRFSLTATGRRVDKERKGTVEAAVRSALNRARPDAIAASRELMKILAEELTKP